MTARGLANLCGVELRTVHSWAARGGLPHFRTPGRHLRFRVEDVERFLAHCGDSRSSRRVLASAVVTLVSARSRRELTRTLGADHVLAVTDPYAVLLRASERPGAVVVERDLLGGVEVLEYCRSIARALPESVVVLVGRQARLGGRCPSNVRVVPDIGNAVQILTVE